MFSYYVVSWIHSFRWLVFCAALRMCVICMYTAHMRILLLKLAAHRTKNLHTPCVWARKTAKKKNCYSKRKKNDEKQRRMKHIIVVLYLDYIEDLIFSSPSRFVLTVVAAHCCLNLLFLSLCLNGFFIRLSKQKKKRTQSPLLDLPLSKDLFFEYMSHVMLIVLCALTFTPQYSFVHSFICQLFSHVQMASSFN